MSRYQRGEKNGQLNAVSVVRLWQVRRSGCHVVRLARLSGKYVGGFFSCLVVEVKPSLYTATKHAIY